MLSMSIIYKLWFSFNYATDIENVFRLVCHARGRISHAFWLGKLPIISELDICKTMELKII